MVIKGRQNGAKVKRREICFRIFLLSTIFVAPEIPEHCSTSGIAFYSVPCSVSLCLCVYMCACIGRCNVKSEVNARSNQKDHFSRRKGTNSCCTSPAFRVDRIATTNSPFVSQKKRKPQRSGSKVQAMLYFFNGKASLYLAPYLVMKLCRCWSIPSFCMRMSTQWQKMCYKVTCANKKIRHRASLEENGGKH